MAVETSVIPIMIPNIAWEKFIKDASAFGGHSPTFTADNSTIPLSDFAKYIVTIDEFQNGQTATALEILRNETNPLKHLFFSFLVTCSPKTLLRIIETTEISVTSRKPQAILSGTLLRWRDALVTYQELKEVRTIFNYCLHFFSRLGLLNIWDNYRRKPFDSETFLLERK